MAIKKEITNRTPPPDRAPLCWRKFSRSPLGVLRIELHSGPTWLLPYAHWTHANLEKTETGEQLMIAFTSHDVRVEGENLKELLLELQASNVEVVREIPKRHRLLADGVIISSITVSEPPANSGAANDRSPSSPAGPVEPEFIAL